MQPEKRRTIESYFHSFTKKPRTSTNEGEIELNVINSSSSSYESEHLLSSSSANPNVSDVNSTIQLSSFDSQNLSSSSDNQKGTSDVNFVTPSSSLICGPSNNTVQVKSTPDDISKSCNDLPAQPKLTTYPNNADKRSFQSSWYKERPWLEYSIKNDMCYCYYCRYFSCNRSINYDAFTTTGFNNWKRSLETNGGLLKHSQSQLHITSTKNYESYVLRQRNNSSVINQLDAGRVIHIRKNRDRLIKICSTLHFLARQMISFRGHRENSQSSNQGNFMELLRWSATSDPVVKSVLEDSAGNASYLSHDIQNELIHIMANQVREKISSMLHNHNYTLMADESRDISGTQQLSIVIRFVHDQDIDMNDYSNIVKDYFLGFLPLQEFDAPALAIRIVQFLNELNIPLQTCISLCFDGASVMSGCHAGLHVVLKEHMPHGIYIHCSAHRLNLVINGTCQVVYYILDYFSILSNIYSFFTESGVTNTYFKKAQQELNLNQSSTLKLWGLTRWDSRWKSIDAIINNYPAIINALSDISEEGGGKRSINAGGLLTHVKKSIFIITSFILHKLFGLIKVLSDHLKSSSLDYVRGEHLVTSIIQQITDLRNEHSYKQIYDKAKQFCDSNGIDLVQQYHINRKTKIPTRFKDCFIDSTVGQREMLSTSTDFMNKIYFPLIDCMLVELNDRFSSKTLALMKSMSTVYPESENFLNSEDVDAFCRHVNVDSSSLKNEFAVIKSMFKTKKIDDVIQFLKELIPYSTAFPQTILMVKNAMTMPVSQ
ncbi:unnamed protein product, partial [Rotaria sordida]